MNIMNNFPILAVIALFMGAFVTALIGRRSEPARRIVVTAAMAIALVLTLCLIKPVFLDGEIIHYAMGNWLTSLVTNSLRMVGTGAPLVIRIGSISSDVER